MTGSDCSGDLGELRGVVWPEYLGELGGVQFCWCPGDSSEDLGGLICCAPREWSLDICLRCFRLGDVVCNVDLGSLGLLVGVDFDLALFCEWRPRRTGSDEYEEWSSDVNVLDPKRRYGSDLVCSGSGEWLAAPLSSGVRVGMASVECGSASLVSWLSSSGVS